VLTPVSNQTYEATSASGAVATFAATATDLLDGIDAVVFKEGGLMKFFKSAPTRKSVRPQSIAILRSFSAAAVALADAREAVKALLIANEFLGRQLETKVSQGYMRGVRHGRSYSG
jgi:hypothetical protein